jgi:hypothetical protein
MLRSGRNRDGRHTPGLARAVRIGAAALLTGLCWSAPGRAAEAADAPPTEEPELVLPEPSAPEPSAPEPSAPEPSAPQRSLRVQPLSQPSLPEQPAAAPIELDGYALAGETRARRAPPEPLRPQLDGIVMFSAVDGLGAGGQLRKGSLGLRATVAYQLLRFMVDEDPGDASFGHFHFAHSLQVNLDTLLIGVDSGKGASLGYRYNDLLGHGVSAAYQSMFEAWGQHFNLSFPIAYYPEATGRVRDHLDLQGDHKINFPFGAGFEFGVGIAWVL